MSLSNAVIQHKNAIASDQSIYLLLQIDIPSLVDPIYITNNNENVSWNSIDWLTFGFTIDDINEDSDGSIPEVNIKISNASRAIELYLNEYDLWLKQNTLEKITVTLFIVSSADLLNTTPIASYSFDVGKYATDANWATFTLTFENFYIKRFPKNRITRNSCRWRFGSIECGYTPGIGETCNKTLTACRSYNNSERFGAFPSVGGTLNKVYL